MANTPAAALKRACGNAWHSCAATNGSIASTSRRQRMAAARSAAGSYGTSTLAQTYSSQPRAEHRESSLHGAHLGTDLKQLAMGGMQRGALAYKT